LGAILGQSPPHNVVLIIDACVAGRLGSAIQRAAEDASDELNNRDPHRPHALVVLASTYGRDPAFDGRFAEAFLRVVSEERWTGTRSRWIDVGQLIQGLNEEFKDIAPAQVAELRVLSTGVAELIPNPNMASRKLGKLILDEEFQTHFVSGGTGRCARRSGNIFQRPRTRAAANCWVVEERFRRCCRPLTPRHHGLSGLWQVRATFPHCGTFRPRASSRRRDPDRLSPGYRSSRKCARRRSLVP